MPSSVLWMRFLSDFSSRFWFFMSETSNSGRYRDASRMETRLHLGLVSLLSVLCFGACTRLSFWPGGNWQKLEDRDSTHLAVLFQGPVTPGHPAEDPLDAQPQTGLKTLQLNLATWRTLV